MLVRRTEALLLASTSKLIREQTHIYKDRCIKVKTRDARRADTLVTSVSLEVSQAALVKRTLATIKVQT